MANLTDLTAAALAAEITAGNASAVDATQAALDAIAARDGVVGAYNEVLADSAVEAARAVDAARTAGQPLGPLAGVPIAVKDNMVTTVGKTTCSSKILADFRAPYTATAVRKLQDAGAVIIGKTNMDEFAMGSSTENSALNPTRNPWDTDRVPGGSSGGSAAAVSARLCAAALGSDTGGSIRQPAAFCGVVGLKPTYGRVSRYGLVAYGSSLDQIGPMTRDVTDTALLTGIIAGGDERDSTSIHEPVDDYLASLETPIDGLRIGMVQEFAGDSLDAEIAATVSKTRDLYESIGATIVDVSLTHSRIDMDDEGQLSSYAVAAYYVVATAEASSNLARFDGVHYGHRTADPTDDIVTLYSRSRAEGFGDEVKRRIMLGTFALSSGYYDAYYNQALKVRRLIKNDFDRAFEQCDVLLAPVTPTTAFKLGEKTADPLAMYLADIFTISVNLAGLPGLALPAGLSSDGMPIGVQLIGPVFSEDRLFRAARMFERAATVPTMTPAMLNE